MKSKAQILFVLASFLALASSLSAQLTTFDTRPQYQGSAITFTSGSTQGQTFSGVYAVSSLTYNFFGGTGGGGLTSGSTLTGVFGQWNGSGFVANTTVSFSTITVPASGSPGWITIPGANAGNYPTFQVTFDLTDTGTNNVANSTLQSVTSSAVTLDSTYGYVTNPGSTYALMLTDTGGGNNLALGLTNADAFPGGSTSFGFNDWVFAQISVATTAIPAVPEPATVASICAAALALGLVAYRVRQQRQLAGKSNTPLAA